MRPGMIRLEVNNPAITIRRGGEIIAVLEHVAEVDEGQFFVGVDVQ